ncbi:MAG: hypothetical protein E6Y30_07980 [Finegoldia magna]|nr:hypothetical protein [Finegoldia magna]
MIRLFTIFLVCFNANLAKLQDYKTTELQASKPKQGFYKNGRKRPYVVMI